MAERSLLREKLELQAAEKRLQLDLKIARAQARAQARERVFAQLEEESKKQTGSDHDKTE